MDRLIRRIIGIQEHDLEDGKLRPEVVVYLAPEQINKGGEDAEPGCRCGKCAFFIPTTSSCLLTSPPKCNAEHGVCALFLGGATLKNEAPRQLISKKEAGYMEDEVSVPTRCGNCEYFDGKEDGDGVGSCQKVGGNIYRNGCCNGWESKEGSKAQ